jgi:hypothetical protein
MAASITYQQHREKCMDALDVMQAPDGCENKSRRSWIASCQLSEPAQYRDSIYLIGTRYILNDDF